MLITKLHIPSTTVNTVRRSDLFEKLNKGLNRKLILISAPAGQNGLLGGQEALLRGQNDDMSLETAFLTAKSRN